MGDGREVAVLPAVRVGLVLVAPPDDDGLGLMASAGGATDVKYARSEAS
jgi:hypothetical protein